jgi:hypothetical protein
LSKINCFCNSKGFELSKVRNLFVLDYGKSDLNMFMQIHEW